MYNKLNDAAIAMNNKINEVFIQNYFLSLPRNKTSMRNKI